MKSRIKKFVYRIKHKFKVILNIKESTHKRNERDMKVAHKILKLLSEDSICIDIGSHNGEWLQYFNSYFPGQKHIAFEPLEKLYNQLKIQFPNFQIYDFALSNKNCKSEFQFVQNLPAWSGFKIQEKYFGNPEIKTIQVQTAKLDEFKFNDEEKINFMKIDIEGGELDCLEGSISFIKRTRVIIYFEHAYIHFANYGNYSKKLYKYFQDLNYKIISLTTELPLLQEEFINLVNKARRKNYKYPSETNFLAIPKEKINELFK